MGDILDGEIYLIVSPNGKYYVGQARCFVKNKGRYIAKGTHGRWKDHISEAYSTKLKQCWALNNAIRKYGPDNFLVRRIMFCNTARLDYYEQKFIALYNSVYPKGYNLTSGGCSTILNETSRQQISTSLKKYFSNPDNRKKQSDAQKKVVFRSDYKRVNQLCHNGKGLPKYMYYFERKDGRKGYAVKNYKTNKRVYFSSSRYTLDEKYTLAVDYLKKSQQNG